MGGRGRGGDAKTMISPNTSFGDIIKMLLSGFQIIRLPNPEISTLISLLHYHASHARSLSLRCIEAMNINTVHNRIGILYFMEKLFHDFTICSTILQFAPRFYNLLHDVTICSTILQFALRFYNLLHDFTICSTILQFDQLVGVCTDRLKKRGLRHGSGSKKGVLGTGQARKRRVLGGTGQDKKRGGGLYRGIYLYWTL